MRKLALVVVVSFLLFAVRKVDGVNAPSQMVYLPIVQKSICPTIERAGISWAGGKFIKNDMEQLCTGWYDNYGWYNNFESYKTSGGIPVIFCDIDDRTGVEFYPLIRNVLGVGYSGFVTVLNEPGRPDQCNRTPDQVAVIFHDIELMLPNAKIVGPRFIMPGYYQQFIARYLARYGSLPQPHAWDVHFYGYTGFATPKDKIDFVCGVLFANGYKTCKLWVTEYGICDTTASPATTKMKIWTEQLLSDPRVERFAVFTSRQYGCFELVGMNGRLTPTGNSFRNSLSGVNNG